jgi:endonuclease YncB( thermonuclease family)
LACDGLIFLALYAGFALRAAGEIFPSSTSVARAQQADGDTQQVGVTRVVDRYTIEVSLAVDGREGVRLISINTPETEDSDVGVQPCGPGASALTTEQLERRTSRWSSMRTG